MSSAATGYYYGSTTGTTKKDETLANIASGQNSTIANSEHTTIMGNTNEKEVKDGI